MDWCRWLEMVGRWLKALGYPKVLEFSECLQGDDDAGKVGLVTLVAWLEDRKIRALEVSERPVLRAGGRAWDQAFQSYLVAIDCPFASQYAQAKGFPVRKWQQNGPQSCASGAIDRKVLTWLLQRAVSYEHEDQDASRHEVMPEQSSEFGDPLQRLCTSLGVDAPRPPCTEDSLARALQIIVDQLQVSHERAGELHGESEADLSQV